MFWWYNIKHTEKEPQKIKTHLELKNFISNQNPNIKITTYRITKILTVK